MREVWLLLIFILCALNNYAQDYYKVSGKVVDAESNTPLAFTAVYVTGSKYCGTVSNDSGEFTLKIPKDIQADSLKFAYIGYESASLHLGDLQSDKNFGTIALLISIIMLDEVTVTPLNPQEIIDKAIQKIPENFDIQPIMLTGFYREIQEVKPVDFKSQNFNDEKYEKDAVLEIYRSPFKEEASKQAEKDFIKLLAWRQNGKITDSVFKNAVGVMRGSGPNSISNDDPLKDIKNTFLWKKNRQKYVFTLKEISTYDNLMVYVIDFDQADNVKEQLFKGTIYIDAQSHAFVLLDYTLSPKGAKYTQAIKSGFIGFKLMQDSKKVMYKKYNDKWNIYFVQQHFSYDMIFYNSYIMKKWFEKNAPGKQSASFSVASSIRFVITDVEKTNVVKFTRNELFKSTTELKTEKNKDNDDIWGKYNYIQMP